MKTTALSIFFILCTSFAFSQLKFNADSLKKHVFTLSDDNFEGRSIGAKGGIKAAEYIANEFESAGIKPFFSDYFHHFSHQSGAITVEGKNIVAVIEGSDPQLKNEYIVIGAHYDHIGYYVNSKNEKIIYNGADDNATGVAAIIELAKEIKKNKTQFSRSVMFVAFDGEESGLNGSKWLVRNTKIKQLSIKLMISIDMIGMLEKAKGLELLGMGTLKNGEIIAKQAAAKNSINILKATKELQDRTDTKPFGDTGIPSIHITTGTVSNYHKPEDDAHLIDYNGMANIVEFTYNLSKKIATEPTVNLVSNLVKANGKPKVKFFTPAVRVNLGSSRHIYNDEFYEAKQSFALQTGLYAHIKLFNRFALQPEILYETLGSKHNNGSYRTHAITTPVNLLIRFAGNREFNTWSYFVLGGYYSYNFAGKIGSSNIDFENAIEPYEYGFDFGFIINIDKIQLGFTRKMGLSNLNQDKNNGHITNGAFFGTLGMQF